MEDEYENRSSSSKRHKRAKNNSPKDTSETRKVETSAHELPMEADDCCSESDSRSTPTKNSANSDSGIFSKAAENTQTSPSCEGGELPSSRNTTTSSSGGGDSTDFSPETVLTDMDSGLEVACNVTVQRETPTEGAEGSVNDDASKSNVAEGNEIGGENTNVPQMRRHIRKSTRNYRRSIVDDLLVPENATDIEADAVGNSATNSSEVLNDNCSSPVLNTETTAAVVNSATTITNTTDSPVERDGDNITRDVSVPSPQSVINSSTDDSLISSIRNFSPALPDEDDDDDDNNDDDMADVEDDDDEMASDIDGSNRSVEDTNTLNEVMNKPKPAYTWNSTYELMRREHGISGNGRYSLRNSISSGFNRRFYSSRQVVERMKLSHCLRKHNGCVNCLNFNRSGDLLCTGSDDTRIIIWDWAQNKANIAFKSGHTENIFQTKFLDSIGSFDIISASRDGQVRRSFIPPSGGKPQTTCLYKHHGSVHRLVLCPQSPFEIISVGEDGNIRQNDLRNDDGVSDLLKVVNERKRRVRLFCISHHPFAPEICVCGCDNFVRVYDKRNMGKTVHEMCPEHLIETTIPQVTCAVYNNTGSEILASYSDDHIYLFNNKTYKKGEYLHRYRGHFNHKTIKGVNFFGPHSEYVISGSDCGNIFFWDKETEAIMNFMPGDTMGVVNCLEPHPTIPVLATSGLDHNVKIWTPSGDKFPPDLTKLEACVKRNLRRSVVDESSEFDDRQFHYFIREFLRRPRGGRGYGYAGAASGADMGDSDDDSDPFESQMWGSSSSSSSSNNDDNADGDGGPQIEGISCRTQ